jgi:hypothetical protein
MMLPERECSRPVILTDQQIKFCVKFWCRLIEERGYGLITPAIIKRYGDHLTKLLKGEYREDTYMASLNFVPLFPLDLALKTSKIENPFPSEWIDLVFREDGTVDLFRDKMFVKEISNADLSC